MPGGGSKDARRTPAQGGPGPGPKGIVKAGGPSQQKKCSRQLSLLSFFETRNAKQQQQADNASPKGSPTEPGPSGRPKEEPEEEVHNEDFGFKLSFSQSYMRLASQAQRPDDDEDMHEGDQESPPSAGPSRQQQHQHHLQDPFQPSQRPFAPAFDEDDLLGPMSQLMADETTRDMFAPLHGLPPINAPPTHVGTQVYGPGHDAHMRTAEDTAGPQTTPRLADGDDTQGTPLASTSGDTARKQQLTQEVAPLSVGEKAQRLFNVFRPRGQCKYLCVIRHGESEYNKAVLMRRGFGDPMIFDPPLTSEGRVQAQSLRSQLSQKLAKYEASHGEALWVVSPLTRALQTFMEACPCPERLHMAAELSRRRRELGEPAGPLTQLGGGGGMSQLQPPNAPRALAASPSGEWGGFSQPLTQSQAGPSSVLRLRGGGAASGTQAPTGRASLGPLSQQPFSQQPYSQQPYSQQAYTQYGASQHPHQATCVGITAPGAGPSGAPLMAAAAAAAAAVGGASGAAGPAAGGSARPLKLAVVPSMAEFVVTAGDVGRPASQLRDDFPQLAHALEALPEVWWYGGDRGNCANARCLDALEPSDKRKHRVDDFARWLNSRPERLIILIGHCSFWHTFLKGRRKERMHNAELYCIPDW